MVRLNQNHLTDKQLELLFRQLEKLIDPKHSTQAGAIMRELLGAEERIMVSKRLAIILLLHEGYSLYKIAKILKVSPATAKIIKHNYDRAGYTTVLSKLAKSKPHYQSIIKTIEVILLAGGIMPRRVGFDRYRGLGG